jgi:serine/threonine protein kinase
MLRRSEKVGHNLKCSVTSNSSSCVSHAGQFGDVYTAKMNRCTVAVKVIKRYSSKRVKEQFENEMSIMSQVSHHNIVRLHGIIRDGETSRDNTQVYTC